MKLFWGTNVLVDCVTLMGWQDQSLLRVWDQPLRVDLKTPPDLPSQVKVEIAGNQVREDSTGLVRVSVDAGSVGVFSRDVPILMAISAQNGADRAVYLHVDLRPLGMRVFDDAEGLHIGGACLKHNHMVGCSAAIALG